MTDGQSNMPWDVKTVLGLKQPVYGTFVGLISPEILCFRVVGIKGLSPRVKFFSPFISPFNFNHELRRNRVNLDERLT